VVAGFSVGNEGFVEGWEEVDCQDGEGGREEVEAENEREEELRVHFRQLSKKIHVELLCHFQLPPLMSPELIHAHEHWGNDDQGKERGRTLGFLRCCEQPISVPLNPSQLTRQRPRLTLDH
jgi:hypothetical protein